MKPKSTNPVPTRREWETQRKAALEDPGKFHGEIAKREIYWFFNKEKIWCKFNGDQWHGYSGLNGAPAADAIPAHIEPWVEAFNDREAPYYRWFAGAQTNACFNEVDAHVLGGFGEEPAIIFESEGWVGSDRGGEPESCQIVSRNELLLQVARGALCLQQLGLNKGDCIVFYMPNSPEHIFLIEAAKRLGVIYTCVFGGLSAKTIAERVIDTQARLVVTCDQFSRNGQLVNGKTDFVDPALEDYVSVERLNRDFPKLLKKLDVSPDSHQAVWSAIDSLFGEETVVESLLLVQTLMDFLRSNKIGHPADFEQRLAKELAAWRGLSVSNVLVVDRRNSTEFTGKNSWDVSFSKVYTKACKTLTDNVTIETIYSIVPPVPVDADFPMFIAYTSGSTGKPKGAVHTHGGYVVGVSHSMKVSFAATPGKDVIYAIADPGWITGQSYLICAPLVNRVTTVIAEGGPLFPFPTRFASILERHNVTILKAGSTFLRAVAAEAGVVKDLSGYNLQHLKVATFCAEPVSPAIQQFGMDHLTENYINSYWATEHGGMILTQFFGNTDYRLKADAHTWAMPWIFAEVRVRQQEFEINEKTRAEYRIAEPSEKGEIVITKPYPYLVRTIWGDPGNAGKSEWRGDLKRFSQTYFEHWAKSGTAGRDVELAYTQGDFACQYADQSFTLHGRSDEVIKTSGHRIGTEEIESAILKDKVLKPDSPVANVIVVGAPDADRGQVPLAFIVLHKGRQLQAEDELRLSQLVAREKGELAIPASYVPLKQFPETRSGKYMRRFLKAILNNEDVGDTSTLRNPDSVDELRSAISRWRGGHNEAALPSDGAQLTKQLKDAPSQQRKELLVAVIMREITQALNLSDKSLLTPDTDLMKFNVNSLTAVKLRNRLKALLLGEVASTPPPNIIFNYPSAAKLADYFFEFGSKAHGKEEILGGSDNNLDLAEDVRPSRSRGFEWRTPKNIFLTGATGYLGSFLLDELLSKTKGKVYCLVRSTPTESGDSRIAGAFKAHSIARRLDERVVVVPGDLALPRLGLSREKFHELSEQIDTIYHAGALVNHVYTYSALKQANVTGTEEVLRLAAKGPLKPVHFISSIGVFLGQSHAGKFIGEWTFSDSMDDLIDGYCKSKWASEKLCRIAAQRGVPVSIYRPGHVAWHSQSGAYNPADFAINLIRLFLTTGRVPNLKTTFDLAPIDYVVGAIVALSLKPESVAQTFSLTSPSAVSLSDLSALLSEIGFRLTAVPVEQWMKNLDAPEFAEDRFAVTCRNFYSDASGKVSGQLGEDEGPVFDVQNTLRGLRGTNINCLKVNGQYLMRLINRLGLKTIPVKKAQ